MRQRSGLAAAALAFLLALSCTPALAGGASSPDGAATPAALDKQQGGGSLDSYADSRQPGGPDAAPSAPQPASSPQIASPSSPLPTSSPLSHTTPSPAATPGKTSQADAAADSRPQARPSAAWTVSFDTAGGSSVGSQTIPDGEQASRPSPDPARDGYLFDGWFQDNVAYDFSQPVTHSTTLTARWTSTDTQHWTISPSQGPAAGGAKTTLTPPKPRGIRFSQISLGYIHSAAISSDGSLYTWGDNGCGQLGDGTTSNRSTPTLVGKPQGAPEGFIWKQIILGDYYSAAIGSDGQIYTWGDNSYGELGDGTTSSRSRPVIIDKPQGAPDGFTWKQADIGWYHSAAIGSDGNLYTWGENSKGQLGDGTTTNRTRPILVGKPQGAPDGFTWKQVSLGGRQSAAIGSDGSLYTWGWNSNGQLGDGTTTDRDTPVQVSKPEGAPNGFTWEQAILGGWQSAAIGSDGNLYTCGWNSGGELGDGTNADRYRPVRVVKPAGVPDGFTWKQISLGNSHSAALGSDGNLYTWGWNSNGQLGDGTTTNRNKPTLVGKPQGAPEGFTWKQIILGRYHSAAVGSDGNLYTWGVNGNGQLGDGTTTNRNRPVMVGFPGAITPTDVLFGQARATGGITAGPDGTWQATTPKHDPGTVDVTVSWNRNGPQPDAHLQYTFTAPGHQVGFASKDGSCPAPTGMPASQTVVQGGQAERPYPDPKAEGCLFDGWFQDNVAYDFTQPVTHDTTLTAHWTREDTQHWTISPTQGPESGGTEVTLTPPAQRGIRFSQISLGEQHSEAIGSDGNLYAWGDNQYGQLGDGTTTNRSTPVMVGKPQGAPDGFIWKQASSSFRHSAAIGSDGQLYAWGRNYYGQLGDGTTINRTRPVKIGKPQGAPDGFTWKQVSMGGDHSAAIGSDGQLYAWGRNENGQLGNGMTTSQCWYRPLLIGKPQGAPDGFTWKQISMGSDHSAAIGSDGQLYTWGWEDSGRLGRSMHDRPGLVGKPQGAPDGFTWKQISMGGSHSAAIGSDGNLYTWGDNLYGQLGDGNWGYWSAQYTPVKINKPQGAPQGFSWTQASLGRWHSAALGSDGSLYTWGHNSYGQLGRDADSWARPVKVDKPQGAAQGFSWTQASLGWWHSAAIGSDGQLYTWGSNSDGQLGRSPSNAWPASRPGPVGFPGKPQATRAAFDGKPGTSLKPSPDGTWKVTTPPYTPGLAPVAIDWTQDGKQQQTDKGNTYRYLSIASLPLTGGDGMLLLLATGLLAAGAATAAKSQRRQARTAA